MTSIKEWQKKYPGHWRKDTQLEDHTPGEYISPTECELWSPTSDMAKELINECTIGMPGWRQHIFIKYIGKRQDQDPTTFIEKEAGYTE